VLPPGCCRGWQVTKDEEAREGARWADRYRIAMSALSVHPPISDMMLRRRERRAGPLSDIGSRSGFVRTRGPAGNAHHFLDELSEGVGFSGRCSTGREYGPEIDPGQFPIL
jgi:hypothetical protein